MPGFLHAAMIASYGGLVEYLYGRTTGTNIGNMTANGGLTAAFDGNTNTVNGSCSTKASSTTAFVGKTLAVASALSRILVSGSNSQGYSGSATPTITLNFYAKQGTAPANETDGTLLGSISFTDTSNESTPREVQSSDKNTVFAHAWVNVQSSVSQSIFVAELQIYGMH